MTGMPNSEHELPSPVSGRIDLFSPEPTGVEALTSQEKPLVSSEKEPTSEGIPQTFSSPNPLVQTTTTPTAAPAKADNVDLSESNINSEDADVIEKVWVDKAKKVIEDNRSNPRQQSIDLARVKADYQKKRFNRDLKLDEKS